MHRSFWTSWRAGSAALSAAGLLAGCATAEPPNAALAAGAASLEAARAAGAAELAPLDWNTARTKLERARVLAQAGKAREAMRLAEQADADAQLARARAGLARSQLAVQELDSALRTLREEMSRQPVRSAPLAAPPPPASAPGPQPPR